MASKTLYAHDFAEGSVVSAYLREQLVDGGPPSGTAIDSSTVQADRSLTFDGLTEGRRYVAYASSRAVSFYMEPGSVDLLRPINGTEAQAIRDSLTGKADAATAALTSATRASAHYLGNATQSEFDGEANMAIQMVAYFGNAGGHAITGRPQAVRTVAKYFEPTTADSAQANSTQATMVAAASAKVQTFPVTGDEADVIVQDNWDAQGTSAGHSFAVEAQGTGRVRKARPIYIAAKAAKDAASVVDEWTGIYIEDPATGSAGTITEKVGVYSRPRIQTETSLVVGTALAGTTSAVRGTTVHIVGTNTTGNPALKLVKKSGSTDNILEIADSGAIPIVLVNQAGQIVLKASGSSHSAGSTNGPQLVMGNVVTAPSVNFTGGAGGFLYVESGALKFRGGAGTVTTLGAA